MANAVLIKVALLGVSSFISFFAHYYIGKRNRTTILIFGGIGTKEAISLQAPGARPVARPIATR